MKLGTLAAAAIISLVGVTGASAQVFVTEPYVADAYVAPPVYAAPAPVYSARGPVILGEPLYAAPAIGGYVPPKYSYTINTPRRGMIYSSYRPSVECTIDGYCY
ncbi:MAG TPA: hypothetical protein VHT68_17650 [Pseudolabrys sp.]|jgi:hypothetical protein|nr:hypothetical protein [Pseudolabrys sp.]